MSQELQRQDLRKVSSREQDQQSQLTAFAVNWSLPLASGLLAEAHFAHSWFLSDWSKNHWLTDDIFSVRCITALYLDILDNTSALCLESVLVKSSSRNIKRQTGTQTKNSKSVVLNRLWKRDVYNTRAETRKHLAWAQRGTCVPGDSNVPFAVYVCEWPQSSGNIDLCL